MKKELKKLPPTVKTKWLEALRSGKYKQTIGKLRKPNGFCCLGVLYDVTSKNKWDNDKDQYCTISGSDSNLNSADVSKNLIKVLDQPLKNDVDSIQGYLAENNDRGWGFKKIANWIEKNL